MRVATLMHEKLAWRGGHTSCQRRPANTGIRSSEARACTWHPAERVLALKCIGFSRGTGACLKMLGCWLDGEVQTPSGPGEQSSKVLLAVQLSTAWHTDPHSYSVVCCCGGDLATSVWGEVGSIDKPRVLHGGQHMLWRILACTGAGALVSHAG